MLLNYGLFTLPEDLKGVFTRFDKKNDGLITFKDVAGELLPAPMCEQVLVEEEVP